MQNHSPNPRLSTCDHMMLSAGGRTHQDIEQLMKTDRTHTGTHCQIANRVLRIFKTLVSKLNAGVMEPNKTGQ